MINNGPDRDSYFHAMFLRGRPDLCSLIERQLKGQYSKRQKYDPTTEPNFYSMPPIQLLPDCNKMNDLSPHVEQAVHLTESKVPADRSKLQQNLSHASWEDDVFKEPATLTPTCEIESLQQSTSAIHQDLQFGKSASSVENEVIAAIHIAEVPNASHAYLGISALPDFDAPTISDNQQPNRAVPANVVAAATSLLATEYSPRLSIDSSSAIVDQYCRNLASNILKGSCYQVPISTNTQQGYSERFLQRNETQMSHQQQDHASNESILPDPAIETTTIRGPHDIDGSSGSGGSSMEQRLYHANLDGLNSK